MRWQRAAHASEEFDIQLYYRRAKSSELMFGDAPYHRELLAQRLGI